MGRILEVESEGMFLKLYRGFAVVEQKGVEVGKVALDDLDGVILQGYGSSITQNLMVSLAERGVPIVVCNTKHIPVGLFWSLEAHHQCGRIARLQCEMKQPLRKQLWKQLIQQKIKNQVALLTALGKENLRLERLVRTVRSGDPENCEAQAAVLYWPLLFGSEFRRDREAEGINALLNYGYTVLRSGVVRAICTAGLLPVHGLHHHNRYNAMPLADDLMEPWRSLIDLAVYALVQQNRLELGREEKLFLVDALRWDLEGQAGLTPLIQAIQQQAVSLAQCAVGERSTLNLAQYPQVSELREVVEEKQCDNSADTESCGQW